jgi:hypothetical protein
VSEDILSLPEEEKSSDRDADPLKEDGSAWCFSDFVKGRSVVDNSFLKMRDADDINEQRYWRLLNKIERTSDESAEVMRYQIEWWSEQSIATLSDYVLAALSKSLDELKFEYDKKGSDVQTFGFVMDQYRREQQYVTFNSESMVQPRRDKLWGQIIACQLMARVRSFLCVTSMDMDVEESGDRVDPTPGDGFDNVAANKDEYLWQIDPIEIFELMQDFLKEHGDTMQKLKMISNTVRLRFSAGQPYEVYHTVLQINRSLQLINRCLNSKSFRHRGTRDKLTKYQFITFVEKLILGTRRPTPYPLGHEDCSEM